MFKSAKKADSDLHSLLRIEGPTGNVWLVDLVGSSYTLGRGDPMSTTKIGFQGPEDEYLSRVHLRLDREDEHALKDTLSR